MDELDLVLESLDTGMEVKSTSDMKLDPDVEMALDEFKNAPSPKDQVEALRLLLRLVER